MRNKGDIAAIPVAASLPIMKNPTYESCLTGPAAREQIIAAAHRARAQAVQRHLLVPLARFCGKLVSIRGLRPLLDPRAAARSA